MCCPSCSLLYRRDPSIKTWPDLTADWLERARCPRLGLLPGSSRIVRIFAFLTCGGYQMPINETRALTLGRMALAHSETTDPDMLAWSRSIGPETFRNLRLKQFLRDYCLVVYCSGFRAATIQKLMPDLEIAFRDFDSTRLSRMRAITPVLQ